MSHTASPREASRRGQASREAVERAARELFAHQGYEGTSVDEIARRAGVSKPTIYSHFGDKAGLFTHILEDACGHLLRPIVGSESDMRPIAEVLLDFARVYTRTVLAPDVIALHRLFIAEAERFPELGQRYHAAGPRAVHAEIARFLRRRAALGEIACADPSMTASQLAATLLTPARLELLFRVVDEPDWDEVDRCSAAAVDLFVTNLRSAKL